MDNFGNLLLYLGFLLLLGSLPAIFLITRSRQRGSNWQKMAAQVGLAFEVKDGEPHISGTYRGREVIIEPVIGGTGRYASVNTLVQAAIRPGKAPETKIVRTPMAMQPKQRDQARAMKGYADIVDIDPGFDKYMIVQTPDPELARKVLGSSMVQHSINTMLTRANQMNVKTSADTIALEANGHQTNPAKLQQALDDVCAAAEAIEAALR